MHVILFIIHFITLVPNVPVSRVNVTCGACGATKNCNVICIWPNRVLKNNLST